MVAIGLGRRTSPAQGETNVRLDALIEQQRRAADLLEQVLRATPTILNAGTAGRGQFDIARTDSSRELT